jgi:hypothetical protein
LSYGERISYEEREHAIKMRRAAKKLHYPNPTRLATKEDFDVGSGITSIVRVRGTYRTYRSR